ncbi:MAG: GNAT family N-acetyltransferase [Bacteroidetes bacterium]|nr:GNAT family N-acetyltransferase [Bacteroidota bacterium]
MTDRFQVHIRKAQSSDCASMLGLIRELADFERAPHEVTVSLDHFRESGFSEKPVWWAFVACVKDEVGKEKIIGMALYYIRYSTWKGQRMYLEDIIVTEAWRGRNIGSLLMNALIVEASQKQLAGISWQVLNWNEPAIQFYKKYGASFDDEWINVSIDV